MDASGECFVVAALRNETLLPEVTLFDLAAGMPQRWDGQWGEG